MQLKVGIIGVGIMGSSVGRALQRNADARIVAVADPNPERLEAAAAEFSTESTYAEFEPMLDKAKPDAVFIATPDWAHLTPVMACLDRGIHVHVEKPMTTDEPEAARPLPHRGRTDSSGQDRPTSDRLRPQEQPDHRADKDAAVLGEGQLADVVSVIARYRPRQLVV
jgi:hypothetical protein